MKFVKNVSLCLIAVPVIFVLLLMFVFAPVTLLLPIGLTKPILNVSHEIAAVFQDPSVLNVDVGNTCTQSGATCLKTFILEGRISVGDGQKFERKLEKLAAVHPEIDVICLNSYGGENEDAAYIAGVIKDRHLKTCVGDMPLKDGMSASSGLRFTAVCESACTLILLAGEERIAIGDRFAFGLHSSRGPTEMGEDAAAPTDTNAPNKPVSFTSSYAMQRVVANYTGKLSVKQEVFENILNVMSQTPGSKIYLASPREQMDLGFFTRRI